MPPSGQAFERIGGNPRRSNSTVNIGSNNAASQQRSNSNPPNRGGGNNQAQRGQSVGGRQGGE